MTALTAINAQADNLEASLASSHNVALYAAKKLKARYSENGAFLGSDLIEGGMSADGHDDDLTEYGKALVASMAPANEADIENWIVELDAISPSASVDDVKLAVRLTALVSRLRGFPADIVYEVLLKSTWRFFPSWFDLEQALKPRKMAREALIEGIRAKLRGVKPEATKEPSQKISSEGAVAALRECGMEDSPIFKGLKWVKPMQGSAK